jgi:hypothetical protein
MRPGRLCSFSCDTDPLRGAGQIVFVLLCGCLPFDDDSSRISSECVQQKFTLRFPSWAKDLSPGAKDLLVHLLGELPDTIVLFGGGREGRSPIRLHTSQGAMAQHDRVSTTVLVE